MVKTFLDWIKTGEDLPALSDVVVSVLQLVSDEKSTIRDLAGVIKRDVSLSGRILKVSNSTFFGFQQKISTIDNAIVALGTNSIRNISLGLSALSLLPRNSDLKSSKIWQRSLLVGVASRELSRLKGYRDVEDSFTAGLLNNIGYIAFYGFQPKKAVKLFKQMESSGNISLEEERALFGLDHTEAGQLLAESWNLPTNLSLAIALHHNAKGFKQFPVKDAVLGQSVYLGSLAEDIFYAPLKKDNMQLFVEECNILMGLSREQAESILQNLHSQLSEIADIFDVDVGPETSYEEMLHKANIELMNINLTAEAMQKHLAEAVERERLLAAQLAKANKKLQQQVIRDALTGLYNRGYFDDAIRKEWSRANRHKHFLSIIMIDIDFFKKVNDTFGHQSGDIVLSEVATMFKEKVRTTDIVARYGGEEFVVILPETGPKGALVVAEKLRLAVENKILNITDHKTLKVTVSCGVASEDPKAGVTPDVLLEKADSALYKAKQTGRNRVVLNQKQVAK